MFDLIANVLAWFYSVWPSFGMAIIFLTMAVMVVVTPFTLKGTRSMLQMQRLQPELKKIQNQHRDDRPKMNEELMKFYQENGINPLGGCLPLLIQLPIFIVLFRVVSGLTRRTTEIGTQLGFTALRDASAADYAATPFEKSEQTFDPEYLSTDTELYARLADETEMVSWGIDLSRSAAAVLSDSFVSALPYLLMIVAVLVTGLYQHRQIQGRNTGAQINPQQQMIMKIMPYFLPVFAYTMPAALVVYFIVSALYRIGQQGYITHSLYSKDDSPGAMLAKQRARDKVTTEKGDGQPASSRAITETKGKATPKRDQKASGKPGSARPKNRSGTGGGRTGKAPSRHGSSSGRTTQPGSQNRSKNKKKRR